MTRAQDRLTCVSLVVCDDVIRDQRTGKMTLINTFDRISAPVFPCHHPKFAVFFTLTNGNGTYDLSVRVEHEESGADILEITGPLEVRDPLGIGQFHVEVAGMEFPEAGKYWVTLRSDGEILAQMPIVLADMSQLTAKEEEEDGN